MPKQNVVIELRSMAQLRQALNDTFDAMEWTYSDVARHARRKVSFAKTVSRFLNGETRSPHFLTVSDIVYALGYQFQVVRKASKGSRRSARRYRIVA